LRRPVSTTGRRRLVVHRTDAPWPDDVRLHAFASDTHPNVQADPNATRTVAALERNGTPLSISTVSLYELFHGLERVQDGEKRRRRIESVLDRKPTREATAAVIKKAGRIDGALADDGRAVGMGETVIAATGLVHEEPVLTRNVDHFDRIDGLDLESY